MKNDRKIKKNQFSTNSYKTQQRITEKEGQIAKKKKKKNTLPVLTLDSGA